MLSFIKGKISEKNLDANIFVVEANNIGYLVNSNLKVLNSIHINEEAKIYLGCKFGEDGYKLYGFIDKATRDIFDILISVNGVGPKAALSILNILDMHELISAVLQEKDKVIATANGIGPKTAKRIILELQNKLSKYSKQNKPSSQENFGNTVEVESILKNLGYTDIDIDKVLSRARENSIQDDTELLIQFCLKELAGNLKV